MRLLLTSGGITNPSIEAALLTMLGKPIAESDALCIPTATYGHPMAGPRSARNYVAGTEPDCPMTGQGWRSFGLLELTALPSLGDDRWIQQAAFVYATDLTLIGVTLVPHGVTVTSEGMQVASLDHTIWFHRPVRADRWWLYDQYSPSASGGRGLALANVFAQDGSLVATVAQEGLIRRRA